MGCDRRAELGLKTVTTRTPRSRRRAVSPEECGWAKRIILRASEVERDRPCPGQSPAVVIRRDVRLRANPTAQSRRAPIAAATRPAAHLAVATLAADGARGPQPDDCVQVAGPALVTRNDSFLVTLTAGRQAQKSFGGTKSTTAFLAPLAW
jgi:hypothetical protein